MDFIRKIVSCFLLILLSNELFASGDLKLEDVTLPFDQWETKCSQVKSKFGGMAHKKGVFLEFKRPDNDSLPIKFLEINGLQIPLLTGAYEQPSISVDGSSVSVKLVELNGLVLIARVEDLESFEDLWAKIDRESGEQITTVDGEKYTSAIYGGPTNSVQMEIDSFTYTPNDLVCSEATRLKDMRIIIALEDKAFKPSDGALPMVALLENKEFKSLIEFEETSNRLHLGITSVLGTKLHTVSYYFKKEQVEVMYDVAALFLKRNQIK